MTPNGIEPIFGMNPALVNNSSEQARTATFKKLMAVSQRNIFAEQYSQRTKRASDLAFNLRQTIGGAPDLSAAFPNTDIGNKLRKVAEVVSVNQSLSPSRQIFFVGVGGGWDTHDNQLDTHPRLLSELSQGMKAFYDTTVDLSLSDQVTTFTGSDFGRTLTSNGDGTDHGWGSHQLVMGGAVNGRTIYGDMPPLAIEGPQDAGRGRIIPTLSTEQYAASLARWFGLNASQIAEVFPNLANFDSPDIGFMV